MKKLFLLLTFLIISNQIMADPLMDSYNLEAKREYAKALETIEGLIKNNPEDYFIQLRAGWLALVKGDYPKSSTYYQNATRLKPNAIEPRLGNVKALLALGKYNDVEVACKTILKLDSKNYFARSTLAYSNYVLTHFKEAEKYYESITNDYPADTEMLIGHGWTLIKLGNKAKAKVIFALLKRMVPNDERVTSGVYYSNN